MERRTAVTASTPTEINLPTAASQAWLQILHVRQAVLALVAVLVAAVAATVAAATSPTTPA